MSIKIQIQMKQSRKLKPMCFFHLQGNFNFLLCVPVALTTSEVNQRVFVSLPLIGDNLMTLVVGFDASIQSELRC